MKYYPTIAASLLITGIVVLGVVALNQQGFIRFRFGDGELLIDGRQQETHVQIENLDTYHQ
ncbi:hypothetical protein IQ260_14635 [Leptolyngbya cf. ectocarpi LEGE 11479]|uniref:Uncharacterized protein n=1 Tax=Leptolyngbya cf. ectocarpi LEGE 11479 TaxID=1828722 RepID=A0A928ZUV4_LEPEC|nr:hypothetical protein [Leptolyngbya ectocarpi]MBE9067888.1 hypothetical protein [Leptolyngbya cf. ectocarpi LEGE 11479]